jgi:hypothetical protein
MAANPRQARVLDAQRIPMPARAVEQHLLARLDMRLATVAPSTRDPA